MIKLFIMLSLFSEVGYYSGVGIVSLKDTTQETIAKAKIKAKQMAREELAKSIRVQVVSITKRIIGENAEKVSDRFENFIQEKTDIVLEGVEYSPPLINYKKKTLSIMAQLSKKEYERKVKEDLENKKSRIIHYYKEFENNLKHGDYTLALKSLYRARGWIREFFNDLPIMTDLNNDGKKEELKAAVVGKIDGLVHKLTLEPAGKKVLFTLSGDVQGPVGFYIYWDENGEKRPVKEFPVYAAFSSGKGKIENAVVFTDNMGYAELKVGDIDPSYKSVTIKITPYVEKFFPPFEGEDKDVALSQFKNELGILPEWNINIEKQKYLALSMYATKGSIPQSIKDEVKEIIRAKGYKVVDKEIRTHIDMKGLKNEGIDYVCVIKINVSSKYISDYEMYVAMASGTIKLYSTDEETELQSIPIGGSKKFGINRSSSIQKAIGALRGSIIRKVKMLNL